MCVVGQKSLCLIEGYIYIYIYCFFLFLTTYLNGPNRTQMNPPEWAQGPNGINTAKTNPLAATQRSQPNQPRLVRAQIEELSSIQKVCFTHVKVTYNRKIYREYNMYNIYIHLYIYILYIRHCSIFPDVLSLMFKVYV